MNLKKKHILLVDDDPFLTALLSQKLLDAGIGKVTVVKTWMECLEHFRNCDAVILDYFLENENGMDVLRSLVSLDPKLPVIFLSSQEYVSIAIKSLRLGAFDYIEKNQLNYDKLINSILLALDKKQQSNKNGTMLHKILTLCGVHLFIGGGTLLR